jgi:hypothetical protein
MNSERVCDTWFGLEEGFANKKTQLEGFFLKDNGINSRFNLLTVNYLKIEGFQLRLLHRLSGK